MREKVAMRLISSGLLGLLVIASMGQVGEILVRLLERIALPLLP
jgi:hypothetical protein